MKPEITIQRLLPEDAATYQAFRLQALQESPDAFGASYEDEQHKPLERVAETLCQDHVFAAKAPDGVMIAVGAYYISPLRKLAHKAHLYGIYVRPEWRKQGVMRSLIQQVLTTAPDKVFCSSVVAQNFEMLRCLEGLGFEAYGTERDAMRAQGQSWDLVHLAKRPHSIRA